MLWPWRPAWRDALRDRLPCDEGIEPSSSSRVTSDADHEVPHPFLLRCHVVTMTSIRQFELGATVNLLGTTGMHR